LPEAHARLGRLLCQSGSNYSRIKGWGQFNEAFLGGLWSAKWWAIYAGQLVGGWNFYYLGAWAYPPAPGTSNPVTGVKAPNPLAVGSFYYDTTAQQLYVWNGGAWVSPYVLTPGYQSTYVYVATAGQTVFFGADSNSHTPVVGQSSSDVHLNGVRLVAVTDYTIDITNSKLTLNIPASINSIVQWDLLVHTSQLAPGAVNAFKTTISRVEDADRHLEQLNRLYLSTIETLAMAISIGSAPRYGRSEASASRQSTAERIRAPIGICSSLRPRG
jgi:hypothetical protein